MQINHRFVIVNPNAATPFVPGQASMPTEHFYVTSLRRVSHPWIESSPVGDGQSVDLVTGKTVDGQMNLRVIDVPEPVCVLQEVVDAGFLVMPTFFTDGWRIKGDTQGQGFPNTTPATDVDDALGGGWWYDAVGVPGLGGSALFMWIDDPGGPPYSLGPFVRETWMERTFGGFTPGERVGFRFRARWTLDTGPGNIFAEVNGDRASFPNGSFDFWTIDPSVGPNVYDNFASGFADGSGNVTIKIGGEGYAPSCNVNCIFDEFEIARCAFPTIVDPTAVERYVTTWLADDNARQQLLGRQAFLEDTFDGGLTFVPRFTGFVSDVQMAKSLVYDFAIGDTRRVERTRPAFHNLTPATDANHQLLTALIGGPVYRGLEPWSPKFQLPLFRIIDQQAASGNTAPNEPPDGWVRLNYIDGPMPPGFRHPGSTHAANLTYNVLNDRARKFYNPDAPSAASLPYGAFPGLRATLLTDPVVPVAHPTVVLDDLVPLGQNFSSLNYVRGLGKRIPVSVERGQEFINKGLEIVLRWGVTDTVTYPTGTYFRVLVTPRDADEDFPLYLRGHPVDVEAALLTRHGISVDTTTRDAVREALGEDLVVVRRCDKKDEKIQAVCEELHNVFGYATRVRGDATREFFIYRALVSSTPGSSIATSDLREEGGPTFEISEADRRNQFRFRQKYLRRVSFDDEDIMQAYDAVEPEENTQAFDFSSDGGATIDAVTYGAREETVELNGFVAWKADRVSSGDLEACKEINAQQWALGLARLLFNYAARGVQFLTLVGTRGVGDIDTIDIGDEVSSDIVHVPNAQLGQVPTSQRGGVRHWRVMQRTDEDSGPKLRLADGGTGVAYGHVPAPELFVDSIDPEFFYEIQIPDPTQFITDRAQLELQVKLGGVVPSPNDNGVRGPTLDGARMVLGDGTTPAVPYSYRIGPFPSRSIVWIRMRGFLFGGTPGAWSAWTGIGGPTGNVGVFDNIAVTAITTDSVSLAWTNTDALNNVKVQYREDGIGAWTDFLPLLSVGATSVTVTGLLDNQLYEFRVVRWDNTGLVEVGTALTVFATTHPTGLTNLTFSNITANEAIAQWVNGNSVHSVKVEIKESTASGYTTYITLMPGSVNTRLSNLKESTTYDVRVVLVASNGGESGSALTNSFTTLAGAGTLGAPTNPKVFAGVDPASGGFSRGLYGISVIADLTNPPHEIVIEQAVETAPGSDTYGAYTQVAFVPASFNGPTIWTDTAPNDLLKRSLRAFARAANWNNSASTIAQAIDPWSVRPPVNTPIYGSLTLPVLGVAEDDNAFEFLEFPPGAEVFKITSVGNKSCRLRIYDSLAARTADLTRDPSQLPNAGTGIFLDVILSPSNAWVQVMNPLARIIDSSGNYNPTVMTYCTVTSYDVGTNDITLTIDYQIPPSTPAGT